MAPSLGWAPLTQVFGFLAFPMSAVWLYAICGELIALLEVHRAVGAQTQAPHRT